jgi:archaeal flagellin FlaB
MSYQRLKEKLMRPQRRSRSALAGLDTAIILIAFVITASVLAYVAVNMGLFVTQKAKAVINNGEQQASTALEVGGSVLYSTNYPTNTKSYWIYFTITPSAGISSVELAPATTSISFTAPAENITLSNMYNYTLLTSTAGTNIIKQVSGGENYYYYASPYAALEDMASQINDTSVLQMQTAGTACTASGAQAWNFSYAGTTKTACVNKDVAFTFPVSGDPLVGSSVAPAGSTIGVMLLFGPNTGSHVFQYQQIQAEITPNIGSSLTVTEYVYQPDGTVTTIG